jgi:hypothetical protein
MALNTGVLPLAKGRALHLFNIKIVFKEINPTETRVVIHKTNIILTPPEETRAGPQTSE